MLTALIWTLVTALFFATISATVSFLARDKMSSFQFFTVSNLLAAAVAWVVLPDWSMAGEVNWGMLFAFTLVTGVVNTASQAMLVQPRWPWSYCCSHFFQLQLNFMLCVTCQCSVCVSKHRCICTP